MNTTEEKEKYHAFIKNEGEGIAFFKESEHDVLLHPDSCMIEVLRKKDRVLVFATNTNVFTYHLDEKPEL